jgi:hypothetical protein
MLDYNKITELFGTPLNTVARPNLPFKLKTWHVVAGLAIAYVLYKGFKAIKEDYRSFLVPKLKKDNDLDQIS